jgi:hypothetical protein
MVARMAISPSSPTAAVAALMVALAAATTAEELAAHCYLDS